MKDIKEKIKEDENDLEHEIENGLNCIENEIDELCKVEINNIIDEADNYEGELLVKEREMEIEVHKEHNTKNSEKPEKKNKKKPKNR